MIKRILVNTSIIAASILLLLVAGEIAIRTYHFLRYVLSIDTVNCIYIDDKLGWRATGNYHFKGRKKDAAGKAYPVEIRTSKDGFKIFGDVNTRKKKVMFIGDSYTYAAEVSNDKTYYGILHDSLPVEVFAYGGLGYGSLQEYMILDEYIDIIRPDAVVWQFHPNDFINNSYELELRSCINNNLMRRPYLTEAGRIIYALPKRWPFIRDMVNRHSRFLYFLMYRVDMLNAIKKETVEREILAEGENHTGFKKASRITGELMKMAASRTGPAVKMYAFCVGDPSPYYEEIKKISELNGIEFIDGIPRAIHEANERGLVTKGGDTAHWNESGHRIAAEVLIKHFTAAWKNKTSVGSAS